jgi:hypothetical protein
MSSRPKTKPFVAASDSESSGLSSAPDDEDFDFEPAKLPTRATARDTTTTRGNLAKRGSILDHAPKGRGRKRLIVQDTPAAGGPRRRVREPYTYEAGAHAGEIEGSTEKPRTWKGNSSGVKAEYPEVSGGKVETPTSPNSTQRKNDRKTSSKAEERDDKEAEDTPRRLKRKRKTREEKEAEAMPLATRASGLKMLVGAHVSAAKGWSSSYSVSRTIPHLGLVLPFFFMRPKYYNTSI